MKNPDCSNTNPFPDEVEVDFHMLGVLMLDRVGGEVDGTDVVTVDEACRGQRVVELLEELLLPRSFGDPVSDSLVFRLCARPRDNVLALA